MPLEYNKSYKSFKNNIKTELDSGKTLQQALAIAYSIKEGKKNEYK